jgi:spoIIIJ-associated protein
VEEATKKALTQLNVGLDEVEVTVLNEGRCGILGLGAEDARISVKLREKSQNVQDSNVATGARAVLEDILSKMGINAEIKMEYGTEIVDDDEGNPITLNITGNDLGSLIGRRGQTLDALQYLVRLITAKQTKSRAPIIIDVEDYKKRRYEDLRTLALNVAEQVKSKKSSLRLEPMSAFERRIIHITLADDPDVTTESIGEGDARKVMILLKSKK